MTNPDELNALADRVEREEPSWRLTCEIEAAITGATLRDDVGGEPIFLEDDTRPLGRRQWRPKHYTTSLDAAETLVPEGRTWTLEVASDESNACVLGHRNWLDCHSIAKTPAAALTAAALRARAADMQARAPEQKGSEQ